MSVQGARGKQAEIQAREAQFVRVAREILLGPEGYQGVSIDRVAEETGFSRGTVYQRFRSKEDLVIALGVECRATLLAAMRGGARYPGRPRERMAALGEALRLYSRHHADDQRILKIIDADMILRRASANQQEVMNGYDVRVFATVLGVVQAGIDEGDLVLRGNSSASGLCFAFWAMIDGSFAASMGGAPLAEAGIADPTSEVVRNCHFLMDGYGWRPLYNEWDYQATAANVREFLSGEFGVSSDQLEAGIRFRPRVVEEGA